jgi:hypothetical protein
MMADLVGDDGLDLAVARRSAIGKLARYERSVRA